MIELASVAAVLTSLKTATDIAKGLRAADVSIAQAELKLKVAELLGSLADARVSAVELQEAIAEKQREIDRLTEALSLKHEVVKHGDAYFKKDANGEATGDAFCLHCWENSKLLCHLVSAPIGAIMMCTTCKTNFNAWQVQGREPTI